MLVTDVGGLAEIVPHNIVGYVTKVDAGEIADSISDFYIHKRETKFSKNTAIEKNKFSWNELVKAIEKLGG
jgi:glycosyltransferase involved in cell wall biosynthesis